MDFHVITRSGIHLVMKTEEGRVVQVFPAPEDSLPALGRTTVEAAKAGALQLL